MNHFHILVVRFSSLGDIILNSSLPSELKKKYGESVFITFLTSEEFAPLVQDHPYIDQVLAYNRRQFSAQTFGPWKKVKELSELFKMVHQLHRQRPVSLMIDLHSTLRSWFLRLFYLWIPRLVVDKRTWERWLLCFLKIDLLSGQGGFWRKYLPLTGGRYGEWLLARTLIDWSKIFDLDQFFPLSKPADRPQDQQLSLIATRPISQKSVVFFSEHLLGQKLVPKKYLLFVPSASFLEKRWPVDRFYSLFEILLDDHDYHPWQLVVTAGPADSFCDVFLPLEKKYPQRFFNLQGKTSLMESAVLAQNAFRVIGNDTGIPHLAEAVGTPALFILGPTGEQFGFYPHLPLSRALFKNLWCRPCTTNGKGHCIRSERFCLTGISVEQVKSEIDLLLKDNPVAPSSTLLAESRQ